MMIRQHKASGLWVTSDGRVIMPPTGGNFKKFRFTFGHKDSHGYMRVVYRGKPYSVHRLVAGAFLDNPLNLPTVDHKDRNPLNNHASNLRYASYSMQNSNKKIVEDSIAKYGGVRACDDKSGYNRAYHANNIERERARCRAYKAEQKALGKRARRCPDGSRRFLTDEEFNERYGKSPTVMAGGAIGENRN